MKETEGRRMKNLKQFTKNNYISCICPNKKKKKEKKSSLAKTHIEV